MLGRLRHAVEGETQVNDPVKIDVSKKIRDGNNEVDITSSFVIFFDTFDHDMVVLSKEGAIEASKKILLAHNVPFCNRVEGAGVEQR